MSDYDTTDMHSMEMHELAEENGRLRSALKEALDAWAQWSECRHMKRPAHPRIAELRKLLESP